MKLGARAIDLSRPHVVGILNITPDSFSDGGELADVEAVLTRAGRMVDAGVDLLDIGGESTRPGASAVCADIELNRVLPAIEALARHHDVPLSIDTRRATVADAALSAGASMVNDVSGFADPAMAEVVRRHGAAWVLMHMPHPVGEMQCSERTKTMAIDTDTGLEQVAETLQRAVDRACAAGVPRSQLAVDPGIGFGKSLAQNLAFLHANTPIDRLDLPVFIGPSRKSFIGAITGGDVEGRLMGTAAAVAAVVFAGAVFVRVHDVAEMRQVVDVAWAIRQSAVRRSGLK
jgi:dihydropteroate synthase